MQAGVAYIPEDRNREGIVGDMTAWENAVLSETQCSSLVKRFFQLDKLSCLSQAQAICNNYDIRTQSLTQPARLLSGGNVQKLLIGRWLARQPRIIACQPSRGLDEGAIQAVHRMMLMAREAGAAVLLISEDLEEVLTLSDRVSVMYNGRLSEPILSQSIG